MFERLYESVAKIHPPLIMRHPVRWVGLIGLCAVFLHHAAVRFQNFDLAIAEVEQLGLLPSAPIAAAVIAIQVVCSLFVISGFLRWIGALTLSGFTIVSTALALPFWSMQPGIERIAATDRFVLHLGVAGGLLIVAWYEVHTWRTRKAD